MPPRLSETLIPDTLKNIRDRLETPTTEDNRSKRRVNKVLGTMRGGGGGGVCVWVGEGEGGGGGRRGRGGGGVRLPDRHPGPTG